MTQWQILLKKTPLVEKDFSTQELLIIWSTKRANIGQECVVLPTPISFKLFELNPAKVSLQSTVTVFQVVYSPSCVLHCPFPLPLSSPSLTPFCCPSLILFAFSLSRAFVRPRMLDSFSILHLVPRSKCHKKLK